MSGSSIFTSLGAALHNLSLRSTTSSVSLRSNATPTASGLESELAAQVEELKSVDDRGYLTISWLCQAMQVVAHTHESLQIFIADLPQGLGEGDYRWLDDYLDESVKLLDVCNSLRDAVDDLKNYSFLIELTIHAFESAMTKVPGSRNSLGEVIVSEAQLGRTKMLIKKCSDKLKKNDDEVSHRKSKLETCNSMLRRMGEKISTEESTRGSLCVSVYASQVLTVIVCGVLTSALSMKARRPLSNITIAGQSSWSSALSSFQQRVKEHLEKRRSKGGTALLEELEITCSTVKSLQELIDKTLIAKVFPVCEEHTKEARQLLKLLQDHSRDLGEGLVLLESHLRNVYKAMVSSRMTLLDVCSPPVP